MKHARSNTNLLKKINGGKNKKTNIFKKASGHQNFNKEQIWKKELRKEK